jgi:cytoskeletal protein CcmA (bactofilin family)
MSAASEHHGRAMELADQADALRRRGLESRSIQIYERALIEAETAVRLSTTNGAGVKTLSVFYRSAASLAIECHEWRKARNLIEQGVEMLPADSVEDELKNLLKRFPLPVEAAKIEIEVAGLICRNALQSDVKIKGTLRAENDLIFNGVLEGEIITAGELTLGTNADVHGEIRARFLNLFGKVRGKVFVEETCRIYPSAVLIGNLKTTDLVLEKGASLIAQFRVGPTPST